MAQVTAEHGASERYDLAETLLWSPQPKPESRGFPCGHTLGLSHRPQTSPVATPWPGMPPSHLLQSLAPEGLERQGSAGKRVLLGALTAPTLHPLALHATPTAYAIGSASLGLSRGTGGSTLQLGQPFSPAETTGKVSQEGPVFPDPGSGPGLLTWSQLRFMP